MGQRRGIGQIVDCDDIDPTVAHGGAHDVAADTAEPVDPDFDGHLRLLRATRETIDCNERLAWWSTPGLKSFDRVMYVIYSVLIVAFFAVMSPSLLYQAVRYRKYIGSLSQRLGYLPISFNLDAGESIWIHAVSVGEVLTARALLPELRERYPRLRLFLSTTTMTGQQIARSGVQYVDEVFYFPFDLTFIVNRTITLVKPRLFIMMETEIWPNLLRACDRAGVKTMLVNGRISSRSYPRYRIARPFFRRVLRHIDRFCMQSDESARRVIDIGAERDRVLVTGSLKFDSLEIPGSSAPDRGRNRVLRFF